MSKFKRTVRGHDPVTLISLVQKACRRNRPDLAAYAASDLLRSGYGEWLWRRITVTAAEDVAAFVMPEVLALRDACARERRARRGPPTRVFVSKAILILCRAWKSRDSDHLSCLVVDRMDDDDPELLALLAEPEVDGVEIPPWTYDVHTSEGRRAGKTKAAFFKDEQAALNP